MLAIERVPGGIVVMWYCDWSNEDEDDDEEEKRFHQNHNMSKKPGSFESFEMFSSGILPPASRVMVSSVARFL